MLNFKKKCEKGKKRGGLKKENNKLLKEEKVGERENKVGKGLKGEK